MGENRTMTQEDYCSKEVTDLLKEKGFICGATYSKGFVKDGDGFVGGLIRHEDKITHQMAMKLLREKYNMIIIIEPHSYSCVENKTSSYVFSLWCGDNYETPTNNHYPTYEEAVEAALKHCLTELI